MRQAQLQTYRSKYYQGTDDDWTQIMLHALGQIGTPTDGSNPSGVELSASIARQASEGNELVIIIRRRIHTITVIPTVHGHRNMLLIDYSKGSAL